MKIRSVVISMLLLLLVFAPGLTSAQGLEACFGLSEDDCSTLLEAMNSSGVGDITSFTLEYDFELSMDNLPDETMSSMVFVSDGSIDISEDMEAMIPVNVQGNVSGGMAEGDGPMASFPLEFRIVSDMFYMTDPFTGAWSGFSLTEAMNDPEFTGQFDAILGGMGGMGGGDQGAMPDLDVLMGLLGILDLPGFITMERMGDDFVLTIDLLALQAITDPEYADVLASVNALLAENNAGTIEEILPLMMMVSEASLTVTQTLNTEYNIIDNYVVEMSVIFDMGMMMGAPGNPSSVYMLLDIAFTNFDNASAVEAPEEWEPLRMFGQGGM